jgi:hypothetical protein
MTMVGASSVTDKQPPGLTCNGQRSPRLWVSDLVGIAILTGNERD